MRPNRIVYIGLYVSTAIWAGTGSHTESRNGEMKNGNEE